MLKKYWYKLFCFLGRLMPPVFYAISILNWYVWQGQPKNNIWQPAPAKQWLLRFLIPCAMSVLVYVGSSCYINGFVVSTSEMVKASYPSILGFAIGLYALVVSSGRYEVLMKTESLREHARLLSVELAYPIYVIFSVMLLNFFVNPDALKSSINCGFGFDVGFFVGSLNIYSIFLIYDMVALVYINSVKRL